MSDVQEDVTLLAHVRAEDEGASTVFEGIVNSVKGFGGAISGIGVGVSEVFANTRAAAGVMGAVVAGVFTETVASATRYGEAVAKVAFLTGETTQQSSGLISAFRAQGFTTDEATTSIQRLTSRLGNIDQQFRSTGKLSAASKEQLKELGLTTEDLVKHGGDLSAQLPKIIDHLKNMKDPLERDRLAMQLFGRNFGSIAPLIDAGGAAFLRAEGDAQKFGVALGPDQVHALEAYKSGIETTKEAIQGITLQIAFYALPAFQKIQDLIKQGVAWWQSLSVGTHKTALEVMKLTAVFGTLFGGAAALSRVIIPLVKTIPFLGDGIAELLTHFVPFIAIIGPLIGLFLILRNEWQHSIAIQKAFAPVLVTLKNILQELGGTLSLVASIVQGFFGAFMGGGRASLDSFIISLAGPLNTALKQVAVWIGMVNGFLMEHKKQFIESATVVRGFVSNALIFLQGAFQTVSGVVRTAVTTVWPVVVSIFSELLPGALSVARAYIGYVEAAFKGFIGAAQIIWTTVGPALQSAFVQLQPYFQQFVDTFRDDILPVLTKVFNFLAIVVPPVLMVLATILSVALPIAIQIVVDTIKILINAFSGIWTVISDVVQLLTDLFSGNWGKLWDDFLKIVNDAATMIDGVMYAILNLFLDIFKGLWPTIQPLLMALWNGIVGKLTDLKNWVGGIFSALGTDVHNRVMGFVNGLLGIWNGMLATVENVWHEFSSRPIYWIVFLVSSAVMWLGNLQVQIAQKFLAIVANAIVFAGNFVVSVITQIKALPGQVMSVLVNLRNMVVSQAVVIVAGAVKMGKDFVAGVVSAAKALPGQIMGLLTGAGRGASSIWATIESEAPKIIARGAKMARDFIAAILGALASLPSHVAAIISSAFGNAAGQARQALHDAHVPGFASGAVVGPGFGGARMAVVGEGNEAEVIAKASSLIRAGMQAAQQGGGFGGGIGGNITIEYHVDGRLIEKRTSKITGRRMRLQGAGIGSNA